MKKTIVLWLIVILSVIILSTIAYAQACEKAHVKNALRKALFDYFKDPSNAKLDLAKIKDLLTFYLNIVPNDIVIDCSGKGKNSGQSYDIIVAEADSLTVSIPICSDQTEYGECSANKPGYCYKGNIKQNCQTCGCPEDDTCQPSGKCKADKGKPSKDRNKTEPPEKPEAVCGDGVCESNLGETELTCSIDCTIPEVNETPPVEEDPVDIIKITKGSASPMGPKIYGDIIVWQDWSSKHIFMYDLSKGRQTKLTKGTMVYSTPDIYGDKIVYNAREGGSSGSTYMYDISTGTEKRVIFGGVSPAIYKDKVVAVTEAYGKGIGIYDISSGTFSTMPEDGVKYIKGNPAIYGDKIVYEHDEGSYQYRDRSVNSNVYMYDISTGEKTQLSTNRYGDWNPSIYGDKVVWDRYNYPAPRVYTYDISAGQESKLTNDVNYEQHSSIYESKVVFEKKGDVYMYDFSTDKETQITANRTGYERRMFPDIHENKVVWVNKPGGEWGEGQIYMTTIS